MTEIFNSIYTLWNQIIYAVSNMRIILDLLDILVIAFILYKAIQFFKETRSGQLVKGIVILVFVYIIANILDLVCIKWILSNVMNWAIIALAVVFQPELRHALEKMGRSKIGFLSSASRKDGDSYKKAIDEICVAADNMHNKKVGALIVFERTTQLGEIIDTGTVINADTSVQMVENIFFPKSPLHDGGVVIRDGRIASAGCILPLTSNQNLNSQFGTRHRAGIGMSENSDAVVLIVSEETGSISIAVNGKITTGYDKVTLKEALYEMLSDDGRITSEDNLFNKIKDRLFTKKKDGEGEENE